MGKEYTSRDYLAQDRTNLANERTLLAYWRTALAFLALGAFLLKYIISQYAAILAYIALLFGTTMFIYGIVRYVKYKKSIKER